MSEILTIGELARRTGVTTSALRYYDELGLVRPIRRVSGHRRGSVDALAAVGGVRGFLEGGFTPSGAKQPLASPQPPPGAWRGLSLSPAPQRGHGQGAPLCLV